MSSLRLQHRREGQKKRSKVVSLNLVSLMDIFTILVFFLMVNSSDETLQSNAKIKLPDSTAEKMPKNQLLISVNQDDLIVMGRRGLGDLGGLLMGSVSHKVCHLADCACLTVK